VAAIDTLIQIQQGNKVGLRESKDLEVLFKALGIGTDNIQIRQSASGELEIVAKLKVADATDAGHVVTKSQLDSATGTVLADVDALETRMDTAEADIVAAEGRLDVDEAAITALDGRLDTAEADIVSLDGRLDTAETTIVSLDGRLDTAEVTIVSLDTRLDTAEATIISLDGRLDVVEPIVTQHTADISALDTRLDTAETEIDQLQADLNTIEANVPDEEEFTAIALQVLFDLTGFTVDASNLIRDIEVFVDGRRQIQATSGIFAGNKGWRKNSTSQIELAEAPGDGKAVTVWKQGTAVVVSGGGGTDLQNIAVHPQPASNGSKSLGTSAKGWDGVHVKDTASAQVWKIQVNGGVLEAISVP